MLLCRNDTLVFVSYMFLCRNDTLVFRSYMLLCRNDTLVHRNWVLKEDGYDHWCLVCQEGGQLLKCDNAACTAVQHAACSTQDDVRASPWVCEDCWMMIGLGKLRLDDIPAGATSTKVQSCWEGSDESDGSQDETPATGSKESV